MEKDTEVLKGEQETCASCGAKLKGQYCRKCGEKKIVPEHDFSMTRFLTQTLGHAVHFDSKLVKSLWLLFSKPGFLSAEWLVGRRVRYMKPLQLFIVAGLLFYFFLAGVPAHFSHGRDLMHGFETRNFLLNTFQFDFSQVLAQKAAARQVNPAALALEIDKAAGQRSKSWLFLLIPFWGTWIYLFYRKKIPWLVPHLIFAMHGLTFYILMDLLIHFILQILGLPPLGKDIMLWLLLFFCLYLLLAVRRFYTSTWPETLAKTIGIEAGFIASLLLYRQMMTIWTVLVI